MNVGNKVFCLKTNQVVKIKKIVTAQINGREVLQYVTTGGIRYFDELVCRRRISDTWYGKILGF